MSTLHSIFKDIAVLEAPKRDLCERILAEIAVRREQRFVRERRVASFGMFLSTVLAAVVGAGYGGEIIRSDFWSLSSLLFSDFPALAASWKSFLFSLLETFPASALAAALFPIFIFLVSLGIYSKADAGRRVFLS